MAMSQCKIHVYLKQMALPAVKTHHLIHAVLQRLHNILKSSNSTLQVLQRHIPTKFSISNCCLLLSYMLYKPLVMNLGLKCSGNEILDSFR